jgi:anti-sigma regulatory factor (Ser/Thr protein kinase)
MNSVLTGGNVVNTTMRKKKKREPDHPEAGPPETNQAAPAGAETAHAEMAHAESAHTEAPPPEMSRTDTGSPRRPLNDSLELGALAGAVPSARLHARMVLREWGLTALADSAELVVSELVTNAVRATRAAGTGEPVCLSLLADDTSVLVVVSDSIPDRPRPRRGGPNDEHGRGLKVVENLCDWWDWKPARGGKLVRALVAAH